MKDIREYIEENSELMLDILAKLISFPSENVQNSDYPFGLANAQCLDYALSLCQEWGMKTVNHDYYVGYGEIGEGDKILGIGTHLDVVPAGSGWDSDPYVMTIKDGKAYGRGASDDKGPTAAALMALKYLIDNNVDLKKRIRIVFGSNEESGFACIHKYIEKEGQFEMGFVPDGPFPCCFGEKGIIRITLSSKNLVFKSIKSGVAANVVPNNCELTLASKLVDKTKVEDYLKNSPLITYSLTEDNDLLTMTTQGRAAHASRPELGINAAAYAIEALIAGGLKDAAIEEIYDKFKTEMHGESCGINLVDKYGKLTLNIGLIEVVDNNIEVTIDIRCPVTHKNEEVLSVLEKTIKNWQFTIVRLSPGMYIPEDSDFVSSLISIYREVTGDDSQPETMGGGTYARVLDNTVAFGMGDKEDTHAHDANEFIRVDKLKRAVEIYIKTLLWMLEK